jgi:membrane fusion protein, multidrug efflux system
MTLICMDISRVWMRCHYIVVLAGLLLAFAGCRGKHQTDSNPPGVEVINVIRKDVPIYDEQVGTLDGLVNAEIRAQVSGYLLTQDYNEGAFVKKGDLLFQIDTRTFQAVLDIAKGQLAQAQAQLGKTELDVKRFTPLAEKKAISQQDLDNAIQANLAAQATVVSAEAAVKQAQLNLDFTRITSPIDGIAGIAVAQIGNLVGPSSGDLTTVSTVDPIKVYFNLPEQTYISYYKKFFNEAGEIKQDEGMELELVLADGKVFPNKGKISAVGRHVSPETGTIRVEALFANPGNVLRPGQFSRVRMLLELRKDVILVPQRAVNETQGSFQVAVVDSNDRVELRSVTVGRHIGNLWVIDEGLEPGDTVVVEGVDRVKQGMLVKTKPFEQAIRFEMETSVKPHEQSAGRGR